MGLKPLTVKKKLVTKTSKEPRTWTDSLDKRPKLWNTDMRFGTWNVRSLYRAGSLKTVLRELARYKLDLVGVKRPLGRPRRRWVDNIRLDLGEVGWGDVDWIGLAKDRNRWRALVNSVLNLRVP
jgi:hypothetical protein